ncbi:MAG: N,N-dimethylformamidase beta subunit family domain-containing protein [Gaiellaceae bacterium]
MQAAFDSESYRPNTAATLRFFDSARGVSVRVYAVAAGADNVGDRPLVRSDAMRGMPVGVVQHIASVHPASRVRIRIGNWPSGLYFAMVRAPAGRVGYAPFVLAPARLGEHRIAVVMPTQTWQAYNFRDDNGDGKPDTWYADPDHLTTARLYRPFENRGVPRHYKFYDEPFLRWLVHENIHVDVISDAELKATSGEALAHVYHVVIFPGHHEYVTQHEFSAITRFRDLGGDLVFLSADNFYAKIEIRDGVMHRVGWYRNLGEPESALIGVQYYAHDNGEHRGPWTIRPSVAGRWLFAGTGLKPGDTFSSGGIEADDVTRASPPGTEVVAEILDLFGDGRNAQMTYYETPRGANVFAAGAFALTCSNWKSPVSRLARNLIDHMMRDG